MVVAAKMHAASGSQSTSLFLKQCLASLYIDIYDCRYFARVMQTWLHMFVQRKDSDHAALILKIAAIGISPWSVNLCWPEAKAECAFILVTCGRDIDTCHVCRCVAGKKGMLLPSA